jgi:hypothetical protein
MEVIPSIIYHYLSIISNLSFLHSSRSYHFQSYVYMRVYTSIYLNYKFSGFHILLSFKKFHPWNLGFLLIHANIIWYLFLFFNYSFPISFQLQMFPLNIFFIRFDLKVQLVQTSVTCQLAFLNHYRWSGQDFKKIQFSFL